MQLVHRLKQSVFLRHNLVFFVGSVGVGALNYLYYPVLGRLMEPAAFGEVQALVSLFLQFTIFLQVLNMVVVNVVVNYKNAAYANLVVFELEKLAVFLALGLIVVSIVLGPWLRDALQFNSQLPFIALALSLLVSVPLAFRGAYARAKNRFDKVSFGLALGAAGKLILSTALVIAGLSTLGAMLGILAAQIIALIYAAVWAARLGFRRPEGARYARRVDMRALTPELRFAGAVLGGSLAIMLLMSIDVLAAKYYFDPQTAGLYAGIATVARIIFFLTISIAGVLLSNVALSHKPAQNRRVLLKSLSLLGIIGGGTLIACMVAPRLIVSTLMGTEYLEYAALLPLLSLAMLIISTLNLLFSYFLALRRAFVAIVGIMGFATTYALLFIWHDSLRAVVDSVLIGSIVTMCLLGIYVVINTTRHRRVLERGTDDTAATHLDHRSDLQ